MSAERLFLTTGMLRRACMNGGWIPLSARLIFDLDFSATQLLLMGVAIEAGLLLSEIPSGVVADVLSRKWSVVIGGFILGAAQFASGIIEQWPLFLVTQFVWGIGWSFISGAEIAWITDELGSPEKAEPLILRRARLQLVAIIIGLVVFAGIGQLFSAQAAVLLAGAIGIGWAAVLAAVMPENHFVAAQSGRRIATFATLLRTGFRITVSTRSLRVLAVVLVIAGMAAETIDRSEIRRLEDLGLSNSWAPLVVLGAIMICKSALGAALLWRYEDRLSGARVVVGFATLLAASGVGVLAFAHTPVLGVAAAVLVAQGAMLDMSGPLRLTWVNAFAPDEVRATVHSFIGQAASLGEILGGLAMGAVAALFTLPVALTIAAGLFGIASLVALQARSEASAAQVP